MNWSKDALFSKAKVYFEKAYDEDKDSIFFGLYCALGIELLARAAVANVSPTLLADTSSGNQENLLYALGIKGANSKTKSIMTNKVITLCGDIIHDFNTDMQTIVTRMTERRNEDLHSGGGGFAEYNSDNWMAGFYKACQVLSNSMGETLDTVFGKKIATIATEIIQQDEEKIKKLVLDNISARKKTYEEDLRNNPDEVQVKKEQSQKIVNTKIHKGFHRVKCPCCENDALIFGKESIDGHEAIKDNEVILRKDVIPNLFHCEVCKLHLSSYTELKIAGLPLHYTNTYYYDPTEYFDIDIDSIKEALYYEEYSND